MPKPRSKRPLKRRSSNACGCFVVYGRKGCGRCDKLHDLFKENKEIATILRSEFVQVLVDVDTQQKVFDQYVKKSEQQNKSEQQGVPFLTVLDSNGKVLVNQGTGVFEAGEAQRRAANTTRGPLKGRAAERPGQNIESQKVKTFGRNGRCRHSTRKGSSPTHSPRPSGNRSASCCTSECRGSFGADCSTSFSTRMPGPVHLRFCQSANRPGTHDERSATPQTHSSRRVSRVSLDGHFGRRIGKPLVTSDAPSSGNIGLPVYPGEIRYFMEMLQQTIQHTTPEQLALIEEKLNEARKQVPRGGRVPLRLRKI